MSGKNVCIINDERVICKNKFCSSAFKSYYACKQEERREAVKACQSEVGGLYATDGKLSLIIGIFCVGGNNLFHKVQ